MVTRNRRSNSRRVTIIRSNKYIWIVWRSNLYYHWNWLHYSTLITLSRLNSSKMKLIWWLISLKRMLGCLIHPRGILHSLSYINWFSRFARPVRKLTLMSRQGGTDRLWWLQFKQNTMWDEIQDMPGEIFDLDIDDRELMPPDMQEDIEKDDPLTDDWSTRNAHTTWTTHVGYWRHCWRVCLQHCPPH